MTKYQLRVVREGVGDPRVHALLYFLPPTGHGVRWRSLLEIKMNRAPPFSIPTCTLQGCWYWDDEEAAWQGKPLFRDQLTTMISESDPHKMIFCNFWPIAHCLKCRWTWFPWSARRILSPRRSCRSSNKMYFFLHFQEFWERTKELFSFKFSSDLQPTGKREDLIPQLHHVPQPGWGRKSFSDRISLETKS